MSDIEKDDSLTRLNTQLNKSMVLMDTSVEDVQTPNKSNRSIKINTKAQPASVSNGRSSGTRKSILKKAKSIDNSKTTELKAGKDLIDTDESDGMENFVLSTSVTKISRPQNLNELMNEDSLIIDSTDCTFDFDDIADDEDIWIMDIPRTVNPQELRGQTLTFGDKSKFKIGEEKYYATNHNPKCRLTCVFRSGQEKQQYKTVNVRPVGTIAIRRKLPNTKKVTAVCTEDTSVPFPENLKIRHPLFGVTYDGKVIKGRKKRSSFGKGKSSSQS